LYLKSYYFFSKRNVVLIKIKTPTIQIVDFNIIVSKSNIIANINVILLEVFIF
jgi:hypothetical protein